MVAPPTPPRPPKSLLFVCLGNICRSPAAESIFRILAEKEGLLEALEVDSAGTVGFHQDAPPDARMVAAARARGYRIEGAARRVKAEDFRDFDLILAMDQENLRDLKAKRPKGAKARIALFSEFCEKKVGADVPDPYYGGPHGFEIVLDMVEEGVRGLIREVS